jgi:hypothetical protein
MDWCAQPQRRTANHPPIAVLNGQSGTAIVRIDVRGGATAKLSARGSTDPDGDSLSYRWFHYPEASDMRSTIELVGADSVETSVTTATAPAAAELHIVLEVRDNGTPMFVSYRRAILRTPAASSDRQHQLKR